MHDNPYQSPKPFEATLADDSPSAAESGEAIRQATSTFRGLLAVYGLVVVAEIVAMFFLESYLPEELQTYLEREIELLSPSWLILIAVLALPTLAFLLAGWFGMFFFWRPSRWLFLAAQVIGFVLVVVGGPSVSHGVEDALRDADGVICGAILAMAFFSPVRVLFAKRPVL